MRIAHIDTERTWRGGEQQALSLIEGLQALGHTNLLIARKNSALAKRASPLVAVMPVCPFGEWDLITAHFVNRRLRAEKIDVVHAHTSHGASLAAIATLGTNIPVVVTRRVDFPLSQNIFSKWKYRRAAKIVAISEGVRQVLLKSGIPENKMTIVPSGVDFNKFKSVKPLSKTQMGLPADCVLVGQVAALAPHKDQNNLIEAAAILKKEIPTLRVLIIGEGELRSELQQKIDRLNLREIVVLAGFQNRPLDYVAGFDVFCLSSKEEGLGTSIIDAMAMRIPVVATKVGGIPELVHDAETGYLATPQDPQSLASALQKALKSGPEKAPFLEKAFQKAKNFDISTTISSMVDVYQHLSTELST